MAMESKNKFKKYWDTEEDKPMEYLSHANNEEKDWLMGDA